MPLPVYLFKNLFLYVSYTFTLLCHWLPKRLLLQLRQNVSCFDCFPRMTLSLAKCKQVFGRALLDVLQRFAYLCDLPQYANGLIFDYIKERRQAIYFNELKKRCT